VARRRGEFLGLTHIDNDNGIAGREAALQLTNLDPYRRILARTTEQTTEMLSWRASEANRAVTQCRLISRRGPISRHNQTKYMVQSGVAETGAQVASLIRSDVAC